MKSEEKINFKISKNDVIRKCVRSSKKAGGQNLNKVSSCVQLTHIPTGIQIQCQDTRDQYKNNIIAWDRLKEKLIMIEVNKKYEKYKNKRNDQIGESGRGTKRRTYKINNNTVIDHITGKKCKWKDILKGKIELLF